MRSIWQVVILWMATVAGALVCAALIRSCVVEKEHRVTTAFKVVGSDMREPVKCEFAHLKYLTLQMHWYDDSATLNADYIAYAEPADEDEVWGWSNCDHDEENNSAWCDIYVVKPDYVHADMNIDTIGHEVLHGACGDFHD